MLSGETVYLRKMQPEDVHLMVLWENNPENWQVSATDKPYTYLELKAFVEDEEPIQLSKQERFIICKCETDEPIGAIDLFDIDFIHGYGSVGILIAENKDRNKGFGAESLFMLIEYAKQELDLRNLLCSIHANNLSSIRTFEKVGFQNIGKRSNLYIDKNSSVDELLFQREL